VQRKLLVERLVVHSSFLFPAIHDFVSLSSDKARQDFTSLPEANSHIPGYEQQRWWRRVDRTRIEESIQPVRNPSRFMNATDLITVDPDILGGTSVFKGTRVPVKTLFEYLEDNDAAGRISGMLPVRDA
jgi:hypothetical protein